MPDAPDGFRPLADARAFADFVGPLHIGRAVRAEADGDATTATVSLTTDYLRPAPAGAWLEARTTVERMGGRLAFADCSVTADGREAVRARAVFAVRSGDEGD